MGLNNPNPAHARAQKAAMVEERRARVAAYKVRGFSLRQIQEELVKDGRVNPDTKEAWSIGILSKDLRVLDARWKAEALRDIDTWRAAEMQRLDHVEREAWAAWYRGIGVKKKTRTERKDGAKGAGAGKAAIETQDLNGDPRYLGEVRECIKARRQMLGLDSASTHVVTGRDGKPIQVESGVDLGALTDEELQQVTDITVRAAARAAVREADAPTETT